MKEIVAYGETLNVSDEFVSFNDSGKKQMSVHLSLSGQDGWAFGKDIPALELDAFLSNEVRTKLFIKDCKMALGLIHRNVDEYLRGL